jgi:hypothetical protein
MKYRAVVIDPKADRETRAVQVFSTSLKPLEEWATAILNQHSDPDKSVVIYETIERPVRVLRVNNGSVVNGSVVDVELK